MVMYILSLLSVLFFSSIGAMEHYNPGRIEKNGQLCVLFSPINNKKSYGDIKEKVTLILKNNPKSVFSIGARCRACDEWLISDLLRFLGLKQSKDKTWCKISSPENNPSAQRKNVKIFPDEINGWSVLELLETRVHVRQMIQNQAYLLFLQRKHNNTPLKNNTLLLKDNTLLKNNELSHNNDWLSKSILNHLGL